jgi:hypothetical protein
VRPPPKPPYNNRPILPASVPISLTEPPSPRSLTQTALGISVNWMEGWNTDKYKPNELEVAKLSCRESSAIGTSQAFDILGEYLPSSSVLPVPERAGTSPTVQTDHSLINPQQSEPIERGEGWLPLPKPTDVKKPAGDPPHSWHQATSTERAPHTDTALTKTIVTRPPAQSGATVVARQQATALAQSGVSRVKLTCPPAQSGASVVARAEAATLVQSGASTVKKSGVQESVGQQTSQ